MVVVEEGEDEGEEEEEEEDDEDETEEEEEEEEEEVVEEEGVEGTVEDDKVEEGEGFGDGVEGFSGGVGNSTSRASAALTISISSGTNQIKLTLGSLLLPS